MPENETLAIMVKVTILERNDEKTKAMGLFFIDTRCEVCEMCLMK